MKLINFIRKIEDEKVLRKIFKYFNDSVEEFTTQVQ